VRSYVRKINKRNRINFNNSSLKGKTILITGGTGTFGKKFGEKIYESLISKDDSSNTFESSDRFTILRNLKKVNKYKNKFKKFKKVSKDFEYNSLNTLRLDKKQIQKVITKFSS